MEGCGGSIWKCWLPPESSLRERRAQAMSVVDGSVKRGRRQSQRRGRSYSEVASRIWERSRFVSKAGLSLSMPTPGRAPCQAQIWLCYLACFKFRGQSKRRSAFIVVLLTSSISMAFEVHDAHEAENVPVALSNFPLSPSSVAQSGTVIKDQYRLRPRQLQPLNSAAAHGVHPR